MGSYTLTIISLTGDVSRAILKDGDDLTIGEDVFENDCEIVELAVDAFGMSGQFENLEEFIPEMDELFFSGFKKHVVDLGEPYSDE